MTCIQITCVLQNTHHNNTQAITDISQSDQMNDLKLSEDKNTHPAIQVMRVIGSMGLQFYMV